MNYPSYRILKRKGVTVKQLSLITGIPASTLYSYCNGSQAIPRETGSLIDNVLGLEDTFYYTNVATRAFLLRAAKNVFAT
jgi:predicted transcriptional regulator